jgi:glycosyltransferase involved in cell wall biosynthesis
MITYNHEDYIAQAIEGVMMQQTTFPIELIIGEDCSTDNTHKICIEYQEKYPDKIRLLLPVSNLGMMKNFITTLNACKGKYIALCEGDDYWIDPLKLQKQVDFLEQNDDYGMVSTLRKNFNQINSKMATPGLKFNEPFKTYTFEDVITKSDIEIPTLTTLIRRNILLEYLDIYNSHSSELSGLDYCLWMYFSYRMKVAVLNEITAVYRILPNSASHSSDVNKLWALRKKYFNDFKFYKSYLPNILSVELWDQAEYKRAKFYYTLAGRSNDIIACNELLKIFKRNKDTFRFLALKYSLKFNLLFSIVILIEKIFRRTRIMSIRKI